MNDIATTASASEGYKPASLDPLRQRVMRILKGTATFEDRFVPDHQQLVEMIEVFRSMGTVIGLTMGVWDLFHIGHARYIEKGKHETAERYPDADHVIMVVGVDTDKITRERKGEGRPVVPETERYEVLGHLRAVDIITPQYEHDQLFKVVSHDVRVVSMSTEDLPSVAHLEKHCAHLVNLPPQAETYTTTRLRKIVIDGRAELYEQIRQRAVSFLADMEKLSNELK